MMASSGSRINPAILLKDFYHIADSHTCSLSIQNQPSSFQPNAMHQARRIERWFRNRRQRRRLDAIVKHSSLFSERHELSRKLPPAQIIDR